MLHGGPGACHNCLLTYAQIADRYGRTVVFYDQIGCGKSAIPHQEDDFYTCDLWIDEFYTVRRALGLNDIHLFGNSWGGMLGMLCMMKDDTGVNSFVINSSQCVSTPGFPKRAASSSTSRRTCRRPWRKRSARATTTRRRRPRQQTSTTSAT